MFKNYQGVDTAFERVASGPLRQPLLRWVGFPFYFGLANEGFALRLNRIIAGTLYLQYRKNILHVNDIEINKPFQGQGWSYHLLDFAQKKALAMNRKFLTLVVTVSNQRALNLYRKSGYLEQHYRYFFLPAQTQEKPHPSSLTNNKLALKPLSGSKARQNLFNFFKHETEVAEPVTGEVWENFYPPKVPGLSEGTSYGIYWDNEPEPAGHADFFGYGVQGRWRIYLTNNKWGSEDELNLFQLLLNWNRNHRLAGLSVMLGSNQHHLKALELANSLGFVEREKERMLMIKPL